MNLATAVMPLRLMAEAFGPRRIALTLAGLFVAGAGLGLLMAREVCDNDPFDS